MSLPDFDVKKAIKERVDLVDIALECTPLIQRGAEWTGKCPFPDHDDSTASFSVNQDKQVFLCRGCSTGGDIFSFVEAVYGYSFKEAMVFLTAKVGIPMEGSEKKLPPAVIKKVEPIEVGDIPEEYRVVLEKAFDAYTKIYLNSPAFYYMKKRGINVRGVRAGYSPGGRFLQGKRLPKNILEELGLVFPATYIGDNNKVMAYPAWKVGTDTLAKRVIFPYQWNGLLTCLHGRRLGEVGKKHLYTRTGDGKWARGVFNEKALSATRIVIVEGAIDALAVEMLQNEIYILAAEAKGKAEGTKIVLTPAILKAMGEVQVVALGSTNSHQAVEAIRDRIKEKTTLIIGFDNDPPKEKILPDGGIELIPGPGDKAAGIFIERFKEHCIRIIPPENCKDWAELTEKRAERQNQKKITNESTKTTL